MVQAGASPQLRIEVGARSYENDLNSYNVLAEIPGTDAMLRDEVVLVGAHLDSWHTATGATDNADGVTAVMEAMRILMAVHARPRRTIRVALWGGEEQGLLAASAYVNQHLRDDVSRSKISVYLNDDPEITDTAGMPQIAAALLYRNVSTLWARSGRTQGGHIKPAFGLVARNC